VTEVGEYGLVQKDMAGMLAYGQIVISAQEREDPPALAHRMEIDNLISDALNQVELVVLGGSTGITTTVRRAGRYGRNGTRSVFCMRRPLTSRRGGGWLRCP
jgi:hypothetical protein